MNLSSVHLLLVSVSVPVSAPMPMPFTNGVVLRCFSLLESAGFDAAPSALAFLAAAPVESLCGPTNRVLQCLEEVDRDLASSSASCVEVDVVRGDGDWSNQIAVRFPDALVEPWRAMTDPDSGDASLCPVFVVDWLLHSKDTMVDDGVHQSIPLVVSSVPSPAVAGASLSSPPPLYSPASRAVVDDRFGVATAGHVGPSTYVRSWFGMVRPRVQMEICSPFDATFRVAFSERSTMLLQVNPFVLPLFLIYLAGESSSRFAICVWCFSK